MQRKLLKFLSALLLTAPLTSAMLAASPAATDTLPSSRVAGQPIDPCLFYRSQAWQHGLGHFSRNMLLSCEAIAARRQAGMHLSDRLVAAEAALEAYRSGVIAAALHHFEENLAFGCNSFLSRVSEEEKSAIAKHSGALGAMEALDAGY